MKAAIIYFSQTGNTRKVARSLALAFSEAGEEVVVASLKKPDRINPAACDLLGVGTPCFSSRAPQPVKDYIHALPDLAGKKAFVFATSGGGPGRVLYEMTTALRARGAQVLGGIVIRGECFHPFPSILGRFPGRPDEKDLAIAADFARSLSDHIRSGKPGLLPGARKDSIHPGKGFYDFVALVNTDAQLRSLLKAPAADPKVCNQCRWCEYACPAQNITLAPYPVLGEKCLRCYRCVTGCPLKAFKAEMRLGDLMSLAFYNTCFERWLGDVGPGEKFY
jgi:flavodoxin/ferredoxin